MGFEQTEICTICVCVTLQYMWEQNILCATHERILSKRHRHNIIFHFLLPEAIMSDNQTTVLMWLLTGCSDCPHNI